MRSTCRRPSARPPLPAAAVALATLLALLPAGASARRAPAEDGAAAAERVLAGAPQAIRAALDASLRGPLARAALGRVLVGGHVDARLLEKSLHNHFFAPYLVDTLIDLDAVQRVPGVDRVLHRIAEAGRGGELPGQNEGADAGVRGASFEISAGARFGDQLQELSADVGGNETDALLKDGTAVEVKFLGRESSGLINKAIEQLRIRAGHERRPVALVVNRQLDPSQLERIQRAGDGRIAVYMATRDGQFRQQLERTKSAHERFAAAKQQRLAERLMGRQNLTARSGLRGQRSPMQLAPHRPMPLSARRSRLP